MIQSRENGTHQRVASNPNRSKPHYLQMTNDNITRNSMNNNYLD